MERVRELKLKQALSLEDACFLLQFIQQQTTPILSLRGLPVNEVAHVHKLPNQEEQPLLQDRGAIQRTAGGRQESDPNEIVGVCTKHDSSVVDITSLNEFPLLSMEDAVVKSHKRTAAAKTKRRITPTPVKSPFATGHKTQFSPPTEASNTSVLLCAFTSSNSQPTADLNKALKEDRREIQKEINMKRNRHAKNIAGQNACSRDRHRILPSQGLDQTEKKSVITSGSLNPSCMLVSNMRQGTIASIQGMSAQKQAQGRCIQLPEGVVTADICGGGKADDFSPVSVSSRPQLEHQEASTLTDPNALDVLSAVYSRVIQDFLVPSIVGEMHFALQLLTLSLSRTALQHLRDVKRVMVFRSVQDCVYFAVSVMDSIRQYFLLLDAGTLHLLAENNRIIALRPQLRHFFLDQLRRSSTDQGVALSKEQLVGVGLGLGNSRNFSDMKAFHAFKKQRDTFYSLLRDWESCHDDPKWSMKDNLGDKIHIIVKKYGEVCCCSYFAKLFLGQLVESCHSSVRRVIGADGLDSDMSQLKMDPSRLIKLAKRFYAPLSGSGACPPPAFNHVEEFYADFIRIADSYAFNSHLKLAISDEIMQLHRTAYLTVKDVRKYFNLLLTARVMAKFLGFLDFLPFSKPSHVVTTRSQLVSLELIRCLDEAGSRGHLCVTVPWLVEYLSMMDSQAASQQQYHSLLLLLVALYRSLRGRDLSSSNTVYLLICTLGWLFEVPNFPSGILSEGGLCLPKSLSYGTVLNSLDSTLCVSSEALYLCCPFLNDFRALLMEYNAGLQTKSNPRRKITPLSTAVEAVENPLKAVEHQVVETFFRNHPPYFKQLCEVTAERLFRLVVQELENDIIPMYVAMACSECLRWLQARMSGRTAPLDNKLFCEFEADRMLAALMSDIFCKLDREIKKCTSKYCQERSEAALTLLPASVPAEVLTIACKITAFWSTQQCLKWARVNARVKVQEKVTSALRKGQHKLQSFLQSSSDGGSSVAACARQEVAGIFTLDVSYSSYAQVLAALHSFKESSSARLGTISDPNDLEAVLVCVHDVMRQSCFIVPGVPFQVMTCQWQGFVHQSVGVALHMVSRGDFGSCEFHNSTLKSGCNVLDQLIDCWRLCKELKLEMSVEELLSVGAFEKYFCAASTNQVLAQAVWLSLANLMVMIVCNGIAPSPVIEALWLCRWNQLQAKVSAEQFRELFGAAGAFLNLWHSIPDTVQNSFFKQVHFSRLSSMIEKQNSLC